MIFESSGIYGSQARYYLHHPSLTALPLSFYSKYRTANSLSCDIITQKSAGLFFSSGG